MVIALSVIAYGWFSQSGVSQVFFAIQTYLFIDLLINGPHFMASYRLLFSRRKNFRDHPIVTIVMPILAFIFLGYVAYWSFQTSESNSTELLGIVVILNWFAPVFLAWHYMGQSWGMTACFAYLSDLRMTPLERRLIRSGFHALFVYHVIVAYNSVGFIQGVFAEEEAGRYLMEFLMSVSRLAVFVTFALGLLGFRLLSKREGKHIPIRVWLPWIATFSWYVMVDVHPAAFFLLQAFHALQYLSFPARVELNEYTNPNYRWIHLPVYYVVLVVVGYVAFEWSSLLGGLEGSRAQLATATMMVINLHHYFIDATIWKIRNPHVREALFKHLDPSGSEGK